jgi:hypothetical protein
MCQCLSLFLNLYHNSTRQGWGRGSNLTKKKKKEKKHSTILKKQKVDHVWYPINGGNYEANLQPLTKKVL